MPLPALRPAVLLGTGLLGALYFLAIGPLRRRRGLGPPVPGRRAASFYAGLLVVLLALGGPLRDLGDHDLFSAHVVQLLLLALVAPPLLLAGLPGWLLEPPLRSPLLRGAARLLTRPPVALTLFGAILVGWHLPDCFDLVMRSPGSRAATRLALLAAATLMWWPVLSPAPELPRLSPGLAMVYLLVLDVLIQIVAAAITTADGVLYPRYAEAPRTWGLSPQDDQLLGGLLLWVPGNLYVVLAVGVVFFRWANEKP